ncbi:MAG TPA: hypothetical protein VE621_03920, partial [Bryobacteraceae bacterium]|nr:hypothetical protein [Bryobacteraceae bacterium]
MSRPWKITLWIGGILTALIGIVIVAALLILPSEWFYKKVRERIITEVERVTGGRVEIGRFHFDWKAMEATVSPFVLHGKEPPGEAPLVRIESLSLGLKVISLWKRDIDLAFL